MEDTTKEYNKDFLNNLFSEVRERFSLPAGGMPIDKGRRLKEMIACQMLIETMEEKGAQKEDLMNVLTYCAVIVDSEKYILDVKRAREELGIKEYADKYMSGT